MQLTTLVLALAAAVSVTAYPAKATINCRTGPGTSYKSVKTYKSGADVKLSCSTNGENIQGSTLWDKTTDGCYVADYYIKTGTSGSVVKSCTSSGGGGGSTGNSAYQGKIKRAEIIKRGQYWVNKHVPYSMNKNTGDSSGRLYRTDCSGFVSMALHAASPGYSTVSLPSIVKAIKWAELKPGDIVGTLGGNTGGKYGHVVLFLKWANSAKTKFTTLECKGTDGCVQWTRVVGATNYGHKYLPYRYKNVSD